MDPVVSPHHGRVSTAQSPQERPRLRRGISAVRMHDDKGSVHTYNEEEKKGLVDIVNDLLKDDIQLQDIVPINPASQDIFDSVHDGVLLCKLINKIRPGTIDPSRINEKSELGLFEKLENLTEAVQGAQIALNMPLVNIGVNDLLEGKPVLVLAILWQLINLHLHTQVAQTAKIVRLDYLLKDDNRDDEQLRILLRWFNHHLKNAKHNRRVSNLAQDIRDSENYIILLHELAPKECSLAPLREPDLFERASLFLEQTNIIVFTKFQRAASPSPPEVPPTKVEVEPPTEIERVKILEERKKIQDEMKTREIQQLQKAIVIAKELMNLPSAEVLTETIAKEEKETIKLQYENEKLQVKVASLQIKAEVSYQETKKVEEEYTKVALEIKTMEETHAKEVTHMKAKLDDGVAKVASLQQKLEESISQTDKLIHQKTELVKQKDELDVKIDKQTRDGSRLSKMKEKLEKDLQSTKTQLTKVQESKVRIEIASTKIEKQVQEINNEIVVINKEIIRVDHYTNVAKDDLEQEQERIVTAQKEKKRLIDRRSELQEKLADLQEEIQREEELTQEILLSEKLHGREQLATFQSDAEKEIHNLKDKKQQEMSANIEVLAQTNSAHLQNTIIQAEIIEQSTELRRTTQRLREANSDILKTEQRNVKLERLITNTSRRIEENAAMLDEETAKLEILRQEEKSSRNHLANRIAATEALEQKTNDLAQKMETLQTDIDSVELKSAMTERDVRSLQLYIDAHDNLPEELWRQHEQHRLYERLDIRKEDEREEERLQKELQRLSRMKDKAELQRELAETEVRKEKEKLTGLKNEANLMEAKKEKPQSRRAKLLQNDDDDDIIAKAKALLEDL